MKLLILCLLVSGCATAPKPPTDLQRCAQAIVVLGTAADCTALAPICQFTMADLRTAQQAGADKQIYCPRLAPGQEAANN
jgi:hypothetical protein